MLFATKDTLYNKNITTVSYLLNGLRVGEFVFDDEDVFIDPKHVHFFLMGISMKNIHVFEDEDGLFHVECLYGRQMLHSVRSYMHDDFALPYSVGLSSLGMHEYEGKKWSELWVSQKRYARHSTVAVSTYFGHSRELVRSLLSEYDLI